MKKVFALLFLIPFCSVSQNDSLPALPLVGVHFGGQLPGGDMVHRFGPNLDAGGMLAYKTRRNWVFGLEGNYMFGRNVKEEVAKNLKNSDGFVVDNEGYPADLRITERALGVHVIAGKLWPVNKSKPNSGLILTVGGGYFQHKVKLYDAQQKIAAIKGELVYGYDRLSNGVSVSAFAGYLHLSENRLLNFYFGVSFYNAFTKSIRKLNYDTGLPDTRLRQDILTGLRVGWILPLYKRAPNEFYYN